MPDAVWLLLAVLANVAGLGWLALGMDVHWTQVTGNGPLLRRKSAVLRVLGATGLAASLAVCLHVDHASMAVLVWFMTLAGAALVVTFTLTWRAHWLRVLLMRGPAG